MPGDRLSGPATRPAMTKKSGAPKKVVASPIRVSSFHFLLVFSMVTGRGFLGECCLFSRGGPAASTCVTAAGLATDDEELNISSNPSSIIGGISMPALQPGHLTRRPAYFSGALTAWPHASQLTRIGICQPVGVRCTTTPLNTVASRLSMGGPTQQTKKAAPSGALTPRGAHGRWAREVPRPWFYTYTRAYALARYLRPSAANWITAAQNRVGAPSIDRSAVRRWL